MSMHLTKQVNVLSFASLILLTEPATAEIFEMDCGWARFRLHDSWLTEPRLTMLYQFDLDYFDYSCDELKFIDKILVCSNINESSYRVNLSKTIKPRPMILASGDEEQEIAFEERHVIEMLNDGKWQEYPVSSETEWVTWPYRAADSFDLTGDWKSVYESTWSFNFALGRLRSESIEKIVQDGAVIDKEHESNVSDCEPIN